jgi:hypothetical protein
MSTKKNKSSFAQKIVTSLLIFQILLIGVQAENCIQQGDSPIEVLLWMIKQCVPVLLQVSRQQNDKDQHKNKGKIHSGKKHNSCTPKKPIILYSSSKKKGRCAKSRCSQHK